MEGDLAKQQTLAAVLAQLNLQAVPFNPYAYTWGKMREPERRVWGGAVTQEGRIQVYPMISAAATAVAEEKEDEDDEEYEEEEEGRAQITERSETEETAEMSRRVGKHPAKPNESSGSTSQPRDFFSEMMKRTAANVFGIEYMTHRPSAIHIDTFAKSSGKLSRMLSGSIQQSVKFGTNTLNYTGLDNAKSSDQLCGKCKEFAPRQKFKLFGMEAMVYLRDTPPFVWGLSDLQENQSKCSFCKLIIRTLELGGTLRQGQNPNAKVRATLTPMIYEGLEWSAGFQGISLTLLRDGLGEPTSQHCICPFPGIIEPLVDPKSHGWWRREADTIVVEDMPRMVDTEVLRTMINLCQQKDYGCVPHGEAVPGLRVIDVKEGCVIDAPPGCSYVSLSYVWGPIKQMRLTSETNKMLTTPGGVTAESTYLSKVVRDSLYLCDSMRERYLWIDTLCIMQDDPDNLATQISYMDAVYMGAKFSIVAAAGSSCEYGLPGVRTDRVPQPILANGTVDGISMVGTHMRREELFTGSTWNTRGWTLQEQVFSRRAFIFTESQVFFVCGQRIVREDCTFTPSPNICEKSPVIFWDWTSREEEEEIERMHFFGTEFPRDQSGTSAFELWKQLSVYYLQRNLTSNSDAINAFKGVLRALDKSLEGFRSAMPKKFFVRSLVWYGLNYRSENENDFPTWSWAAWKRPGPDSVIGFQEQNDCIQWTPTFTALDDWTSDPESNFREPEVFGHSHSHDNFRGQEHFECSQNSATFNVDRDFKHEHFASKEVDKEDMERIAKPLPNNQKLSNIVFFYTSTVSLTVDRTPEAEKDVQNQARYAIRSSADKILDYILLDIAWRAKQPDKLDFIALFVHEDRYPPVFAVALTRMSEYHKRSDRESYHPGKYPSDDDCYAVVAMLVEWDQNGIARRIAIPEENAFYYKEWLVEVPEFRLTALG